jgi:nicotinate-nucleotide adenylyltransferase
VSERIGILGGAFDPIHLGHLILASEARSQLNLDLVLFVPTYQSAHQNKEIATPFVHRCSMVAEAISGNPDFRLSDVECRLKGRSYTVQTIQALQQEYTDASFVLIIGADNFEQFDTWHEPERLLSMTTIAVAGRPGHAIAPSQSKWQPAVIDMPLIGISASDLRRRVRAGISIRFLVPPVVDDYIAQTGLYRE